MKNLILLLFISLSPNLTNAQVRSSIDSANVPLACRRALSRLLPADADSVIWKYQMNNDGTKEYIADFKQLNLFLFAQFGSDGEIDKYYKLMSLEAVPLVVQRAINKKAKRVRKKHPHSILFIFEHGELDWKRFTVKFYESEEARKADEPSFDGLEIYDDGTIRKTPDFR